MTHVISVKKYVHQLQTEFQGILHQGCISCCGDGMNF